MGKGHSLVLEARDQDYRFSEVMKLVILAWPQTDYIARSGEPAYKPLQTHEQQHSATEHTGRCLWCLKHAAGGQIVLKACPIDGFSQDIHNLLPKCTLVGLYELLSHHHSGRSHESTFHFFQLSRRVAGCIFSKK